jgi:serine protease Do
MRASLIPVVLICLQANCFAQVAAATTSAETNLRRTVVVDVVEKTKGAVVYISTTKLVQQRMSPFGADPFWQPFGDVMQVPANSLGSGFVVHEDGYIVTNHHVIDRARQISVELDDGRKLPAELVSSDPDKDLAILKVRSPTPLQRLELGDSSDLLIGEPVIAVGNPLGYSHSISTGIVSAVHRDLKGPQDEVLLSDLVQTDAAINPGNSGGPLLNAYGQVIGINTAIRGDAQNIGFAIQVNALRELVPDLMSPRQVGGVDLPVRLRERRTLQPPAAITATVEILAEGRPPAEVRQLNGRPVRDIIDACAALLTVRAGETVTLTLADGSTTQVQAKPIPEPDVIVQAKQLLGLTVEPLTPVLAEKHGLSTETGLLIAEVAADSIGAKAGLEPGDAIVQLGRYRVRDLKDFAGLLEHLPSSGRVRVGVVRGDRVGYAILEM